MEANKAARQAVDAQNAEVFKTFIVHFMGDDEYSFYNVREEQSAAMEMAAGAMGRATSASPSSSVLQADDSPQIDTGDGAQEAQPGNFAHELEQ